MNEHYLWDRTGEADEEIEELERVLGKLKHQPRQLEMPAGLTVRRKSSTLRAFAIAATIAVLMLGAGLWRSRQGSLKLETTHTADNSSMESFHRQPPTSVPAASVGDDAPESIPAGTFKSPNRARHSSLIASGKRERVATQAEPELPASEVAEAQAAKQQLLLALRVVSAKLTVAQKRTQAANPVNQIHNQHKIG